MKNKTAILLIVLLAAQPVVLFAAEELLVPDSDITIDVSGHDQARQRMEQMHAQHAEIQARMKQMHEQMRERIAQRNEEFQQMYGSITLPNSNPSTGMGMMDTDVFTMPLPSPFTETRTEDSFSVIPNTTPDSQELKQIREDMQIMYAILAENVQNRDYTKSNELSIRIYQNVFRQDCMQRQAMYIQDYGMIFFVDVNFPLVPVLTEKKESEPKQEDDEDPVWDHMRRRLHGQNIPAPDCQEDQSIEYDAEKVKQLQQNLIDVCRHAANIRNLAPDDKVVFMTRFTPKGSRIYIEKFSTGQNPIHIQTNKRIPTSCLIMSAKKKDIDQFADQKIDEETFAERITIVNY